MSIKVYPEKIVIYEDEETIATITVFGRDSCEIVVKQLFTADDWQRASDAIYKALKVMQEGI